jgi:aldehyde dehydrogenase (NAD+)
MESAVTAVESEREAIAALHARQREAMQVRGRWSAAERRERLRRLERAVRWNIKPLRAALYKDFRKPADEVDATEINPTLAEIRHAIRHVEHWMRPVRVATPAVLLAARSEIRREPKGQVLILSPWNYPIFLTLPPLVAAIAAGNRVIVRPSEKTPHTAHVLGTIVSQAFAADDVALVHGGIEVSEYLLTLPFDHYFFTGSARVGKRVMHAAAEHLGGVTLELGGKSPAIVDESADVRTAAERIVWGKFINAGQTCVAPDYVLVHERRAEALIREMQRSLDHAFGRGAKKKAASAALCRIIDDAAYARLTDTLERSLFSGARIDTGGERDAASRYIAPTILSDVRNDSPIMESEIFGPILPVLRLGTLDEALQIVNSRPKPLALYLFSRRRARIEAVLEKTTAGGTMVNGTVMHLGNPDLPFGGIGESGVGNYHGEFGFRTFSHERAVVTQGRFALAPLLYPPYGVRTKIIAAFVRRFLT